MKGEIEGDPREHRHRAIWHRPHQVDRQSPVQRPPAFVRHDVLGHPYDPAALSLGVVSAVPVEGPLLGLEARPHDLVRVGDYRCGHLRCG